MNKLLIIFLCIFSILINAQTTYSQSTREQIISAYLLNFTDYVIWENEKSITDFKILILTNPNENNSIFKNIEKVGNKKFKSIKVSITNDFDEKLLSEAQMIFVAKDKSEFINDIFEKIEFKPILLVTEN
ncbi:MAG: YfiR family protein, partial [Bacteroidales bacterium]|nr:YfiR family protein [Bacteroidales bacterium]